MICKKFFYRIITAVICIALIIFTALSFSSCGYKEISKKLVADAVIISDDKFQLIVDSREEPKVYTANYKAFDNSIKEIKQKYDYEPFLSHSKEILITTNITVRELNNLIKELKNYHQIPPDIKIALTDSNLIKSLENGDFTTEEIHTIIKNKSVCDDRLCHYDGRISGSEFAVLYEKDGEINIKSITI